MYVHMYVHNYVINYPQQDRRKFNKRLAVILHEAFIIFRKNVFPKNFLFFLNPVVSTFFIFVSVAFTKSFFDGLSAIGKSDAFKIMVRW